MYMKYCIVICMFALPICSGCGGDEKSSLTMEEQFIESYKVAYEAGEEEDILELVYWQDVPEEARKLVGRSFTMHSGVHLITQIELGEYDEGIIPRQKEFMGKRIKLNLEPKYILYVSSAGNEGYKGGASTFNLHAPVGVHNDKIFFCAFAWDTE